MSSTFLRGLALLEIVDRHGPLTITELAKRTGVDKATVSRLVASCLVDGWVMKTPRGVTLGPRTALLGRWGFGSDVIRAAEPLVHAVAGTTGLLTHAYGLVGSSVVLLASADGREEPSTPAPGDSVGGIVNVTAAGRAIAAQLSPRDLDGVLPAEPYPSGAEFIESMKNVLTAAPGFSRRFGGGDRSASEGIPTTRKQLDRQLEEIRRVGVVFDRGDVHPSMACIAVPWRHPTLPAAIACLGLPSDVADNEAVALRCLIAAVQPAATPRDVIMAAANG